MHKSQVTGFKNVDVYLNGKYQTSIATLTSRVTAGFSGVYYPTPEDVFNSFPKHLGYSYKVER